MSSTNGVGGASTANAAASGINSVPRAGSNSASSSPPIQPTLKVMRLYKPKLYSNTIAGGSTLPVALMPNEQAIPHEFAMSSMLILPDSFGEIFLGNTFSSYISVINQYTCDLQEVGLTANIQCGNDRIELRDNRHARTGKFPPSNPIPVLSAGTSLDMVVDFPLTQVGNHVLRVGVTYLDPMTNEPKSLRKFYRFAVQNPLVMNFKQSRLEDDSLVEAQIRNASKLSLCLDTIEFQTVTPFTVTELQAKLVQKDSKNPAELLDEYEEDEQWISSILDKSNATLLHPQEEIQRVFRITANAADDISSPQQSSQNLGRLNVAWKTTLGEAGSVQSPPIVRKTDSARDVLLTIDVQEIPKQVVLGVPFVLHVRVQNNSARPLNLQLQFRPEQMQGIVCSSVSQLMVGTLAPKQTQALAMEFLPIATGLQPLQGAALLDVDAGHEFFQNKLLTKLFVQMPPPTAVAATAPEMQQQQQQQQQHP